MWKEQQRLSIDCFRRFSTDHQWQWSPKLLILISTYVSQENGSFFSPCEKSYWFIFTDNLSKIISCQILTPILCKIITRWPKKHNFILKKSAKIIVINKVLKNLNGIFYVGCYSYFCTFWPFDYVRPFLDFLGGKTVVFKRPGIKI